MKRINFLAKPITIITVMMLLFTSCASLAVLGGEGAWARATLKKLTLREKIAQMMLFHAMSMSFLNDESEEWQELVDLIQSDGIGGIHLSRGDVSSSLTMMNRLQKLSRVPILFDADIERGVGQRFPGSTDLPVLMAVGATGNPEYAYQTGRITALEGKAVGIHLNLMPVVDVNNNPANPIINTRSYGEDPQKVIEFSRAFIRGMRDNGMLGTAKHFPGPAATETDSHSNLAVIPSDSARLWSVELPPFIAAIEEGIDLVMTAHIRAPDYQPHAETPATLSKFWTTEVLRKQLGFKGVVITDAMDMGGVTQNYTDAYALIEAINAGNDIIIIKTYNLRRSIDIVEKAVRDGLISEDRINEAALKMLMLKEKVGLHRNRYTSQEQAYKLVGNPEFQQIVNEIAADAITLVKNEGDLVPLRATTEDDTVYVIDLYDYPYNHSLTLVTRGLMYSGLPVQPLQLDESDPPEYYESVVASIPESGRVVLNAFCSLGVRKDRIFLPDHQVQFVKALRERTDRLIVTSFGTPYLIQAFPEVPAYLAAYHYSGLMQRALAGALLGETAISGRLPITIPGVAEIGTGVQLPENPLEMEEPPPPPPHVVRALPEEVGADISHIRPMLEATVEDTAWPGGVLLAARNGKIFIHEAFGFHTYEKQHPTTRGDIFDLASVTKTVATTSAVMKLVELGQLGLDDKVVSYLPGFRGPDPEQTRMKSQVTVRHLLTHTSGWPEWQPVYLMGKTAEERLNSMYALPLVAPPGTQYAYSCKGFITLGKIVEKVTSQPLDQFVQDSIFQRLGMNSTYYNPPVTRFKRVVPTEVDTIYRHTLVKGVVHDENAYSIGGVSGNAGLFSTANDLAIFSQMMLNGGVYRDSVIFQPETVELFTQRANVLEGSSRCLGWDSPPGEESCGIYASSNSFGHTGFTGISLWVDPDSQMIVVLLTNAVHPHREWKIPKYFDWRQRVVSAVYECFPNAVPNPALIEQEATAPH
ncbi:MAG: glycoside hydrolase family 3 N-terminal domain-containing protein [Candidatus Neomarinimicrobiota bacterium]